MAPFGATLYTASSCREETYIWPSRSKAIAVAFIMSLRNGVTLWLVSILKIDTGTFCPRDPENVT